MDLQEKIDQLSKQLNELARQQTGISKQILQLMEELEKLKREASAEQTQIPAAPPKVIEFEKVITVPAAPPPAPVQQPIASKKKKRSTLEEFIGGNLTSKAGILITIIGIFIGSKYAIEHNLVNPVIRVIMGYTNGLILAGIAIRLKKKYENYSAVLMGGGLAVLYFITYVAYSFYAMIPQLAAFGLMLLFTAATVYASLLYNRIIIAHLGLIGAYAIPILLSDNSGRYGVLFTYISIINAGMMVLSFKKYWKSLFYVSFLLTWSIYSVWYTFISQDSHFTLALVFLVVFFTIFYITFLAYKLVKKELYNVWDVAVLLSNAFIFYGFGYSILESNENTDEVIGAFTLINAAIHFTVSMIIRKLQLADKALFYLLLGLVIAFITIAIPVQLNGNWVTLLWTAEAVLVFYIGRTQQRASYEKLAIVLSILAFVSLLEDWSSHPAMDGDFEGSHPLIFNIRFLTGLLAAAGQAAIVYLHLRKKTTDTGPWRPPYLVFYDYLLPVVLLLTLYFLFLLEVLAYFKEIGLQTFNQAFMEEIRAFQSSAVILYTMLFLAVVCWVNERWIRNKTLGAGAVSLGVFVIAIFLLLGLPGLNDLSGFHLGKRQTYFGAGNIFIRYAMIAVAILLIVLGRRSIQLFGGERIYHVLHGVFMHVAVLAIISYEYLNWMGLNSSVDEYKLGLSIVWSVYALWLVVMGINKKKRHWRLTGICFFIITLVKLFLYDLTQATTISKTISFISLGAILLLVSYLYNRYKHVILAEDE